MLYVVGLPVGNYADMPPRNLQMIKDAKHLVVENTRHFEQFLHTFKIDKSNCNIMYLITQSKDMAQDPAELEIASKVLEYLKMEEDVYLICDDGMPGIADPGSRLIQRCIHHGIKVSATPGPSAVMAAVTVAAMGHNFSFHSFFARDKIERQKELTRLAQGHFANVFMLRNAISPTEFLPEIEEVFPEIIQIWGDRRATLCINLTMSNETVVRGKISYLLEYILKHRKTEDKIMIVIEGKH
jgi:16S rRNA (cytidine1402-2'-O)-methyltransferase